MTLFQIESNKFELTYARFLRRIRNSIQETFLQEKKNHALTQEKMAKKLGVDRSTVSKRLKGQGNITLKTFSDLFVAMDREPLENFRATDISQEATNITVPQANVSVTVNVYVYSDGVKNKDYVINQINTEECAPRHSTSLSNQYMSTRGWIQTQSASLGMFVK